MVSWTLVSLAFGQAPPLDRAQRLIEEAQTAYFQNHDVAGAKRLLDNAVSACTSASDDPCEAAVQINRGAFFKMVRQYEDALDAYNRAIEIRTVAGTPSDLGQAVAFRAAVFQDQAQWQRAFDDYSRAKALYAQAVDAEGTAHSAALAGFCLENLNRPSEAVAYYAEALRIWPENSPDPNRTSAFLRLGGIEGREGNVQDAITNFVQGIANADRIGDSATRVDARLAAGMYRRSLGDYDSARSLYNQALQLAIDSKRPADAASARNDLGLLAAVSGDYAEAERLLRESLESMQGTQRATTLNNLAGVLDHTGRFDEALNNFNEALDIDTKVGDKRGIETVENNLGELNSRLGRRPEAIRHYKAAAYLAGQVGDLAGRATALSNLGSMYDDLQDYSTALDVLQQAFAIRERLGDKPGEAATLNVMASVYSNRNDNLRALAEFEHVRDLRSEREDKDGLAAAWNNIGAVYDRMGESARAEEALNQALSLRVSMNDSAGEASVYVNLGSVRVHQNRPDDALSYYTAALDRLEKLRSTSVVDEFRSGIASSVSGVYASVIDIYMTQRRYREAFEMAERARARSYLDDLRRARGANLPPAPPELSTKARTLQQKISALEQAAKSSNSPEVREELTAAREEQRDLRIRIEAESRGATADTIASPATLAEVQRSLPLDTTLVSYFGTVQEIYIFLITRNTFHAFGGPDAGTAVRDAAREYLAFATEDSGREPMNLLARNLSKPLEGKIKTRRICIAPHRFLHGFPFAALPFEGGLLNTNHALYYTPSPSAFVRLRQTAAHSHGGVAVFAQGELPGAAKLQHAEDEARQVSREYSLAADLNASETGVRAALGRFGTVHIAAHAEVDAAAQLSRVYLRSDTSNDGLFEFDEIMNSDYAGSDLVVLSACNTNLGLGTTGDELQSLSRAFLFSGVRTVVASLWQVDDALTSELMAQFHRELRSGTSKVEALNRAQTAIRRKNPNPYYWASFVLVGEPNRPGR